MALVDFWSIPDEKRIVARAERLLGRVAGLEAEVRRQLELLAGLMQSVLREAFEESSNYKNREKVKRFASRKSVVKI